MFAAQGQAQVFLATIYAGLAAGVAYDLLRLLRLLMKVGPVVTALLDVVFWILAAGLVALAAAFSGAAGLRYYLVLGAACGMLLWALGLRRMMLSVGQFLSSTAIKLLGGEKENGESTQGAGKGADQGELADKR